MSTPKQRLIEAVVKIVRDIYIVYINSKLFNTDFKIRRNDYATEYQLWVWVYCSGENVCKYYKPKEISIKKIKSDIVKIKNGDIIFPVFSRL